jgi:hypothetical protein
LNLRQNASASPYARAKKTRQRIVTGLFVNSTAVTFVFDNGEKDQTENEEKIFHNETFFERKTKKYYIDFQFSNFSCSFISLSFTLAWIGRFKRVISLKNNEKN